MTVLLKLRERASAFCTARTAALRAFVAMLTVFIVGFFPVAAVADAYPLPYAIVSKRTFTTQNTVPPSKVTVYEVSVPGSIGGEFHDPRYALPAATYLNEMAIASNRCQKSEYDRARRALALLSEEAVAKAEKELARDDKSAEFDSLLRASIDSSSFDVLHPPPYQGCGPATSLRTEVRIPSPPSENRPQDQVMMLSPGSGGGFMHTMITSPTDKMTFRYSTPMFAVDGQVNDGRWFANGQVALPAFPNGTSTDTFSGGSSSSFEINTGLVGIAQASVGYNVYQTPTTQIGVLGQFYASSESLSGVFPGSLTQISLLTDRWLAGGGGAKFDQQVLWGNFAVTFTASAVGLFDNVQSGTFNGNGGGFQTSAGFYVPVGPMQFGIVGQFTNLNASGSSSLGVPLRYNTQDLGVWARLGFRIWNPEGPMP